MNNEEARPPAPPVPADASEGTSECMGRFRHYFKWVWKGDVWTDTLVCSTCGTVKQKAERFPGQ
jgi:hypothetical protein